MVNLGSHMLEKYLSLEGFLEKSLESKYALKSPWKVNMPSKVLENHSKALKSP